MSGCESSGAIVSDTNWMQPSERGFWVVLPLCAGGVGVGGLLSPTEDRFPSGEALLDLTSHAELPSAGMDQRKGPSLRVHMLRIGVAEIGIMHRPK